MKKLLFIASLIVLLFMIALPVMAQKPGGSSEGGRVVFGTNFTLEEGDVIKGDVVVFGGNFEMEAGSKVKGDVVVFGGNVNIAGEVKGDVAAIGGNVYVDEDGAVKGDLVGLGGQIEVAEGADVSGAVGEGPEFSFGEKGFSFEIPPIPTITAPQHAPEPPQTPELPKPPVAPKREVKPHTGSSFFSWLAHFIGDGIAGIFWAAILGGLSVLLVLFFPAHIRTIEDTLSKAAPISFVLGVVTLAATAATVALLTLFFWLIIPLCGIFIVGLFWTLAMFAGWTVAGKLLGNKIFSAFGNSKASNISTTLLGVTALTLISVMPFLDQLPDLGWMFDFAGGVVGFLAGSVGLGAVVLSRFGTRRYQTGATAALLSAKTAPPSPEDEAAAPNETETPDSDNE